MKGKRGRKKKVEGSIRSDAQSKGGEPASVKDGEEGDEEEEDEEGGPDGMVEEGERVDKAKEKEKLAYVHVFPNAKVGVLIYLGFSSMPSTAIKQTATTCIAESS